MDYISRDPRACNVSGPDAFAFGSNVQVSGVRSCGFGTDVTVNGNRSFGLGVDLTVTGDDTWKIGSNLATVEIEPNGDIAIKSRNAKITFGEAGITITTPRGTLSLDSIVERLEAADNAHRCY
jgi:hypothetical protein